MIKTIWEEPEPITVDQNLLSQTGLPEDILVILQKRGYTTPESIAAFLDPDQYTPIDPYQLTDLEIAVKRIQKAIKENERIHIWGDFDVDGITATALFVKGLSSLGGKVNFTLPIRTEGTHGIHLPKVRKIIEQGIDLFITCDTGITEFEAFKLLKDANVDSIITDHHICSDTLPEAVAVIDPHRHEGDHPLKVLCGAGVVFKILSALYKDINHPDFDEFFTFAGLGTIADMVPLTGESRWIAQKGLTALQKTENPGLNQIIKLARLTRDQINEFDAGFQIAPRLNALGRLDDANRAVQLLLSDDETQTLEIALDMEQLNNERKLLSQDVFKSAEKQYLADKTLQKQPIIFLCNPDWNSSVLGVAANQMVNTWQKPTFLINTPEGKTARGSVRSLGSFNILDLIDQVSNELIQYGGHAYAAGLSFEPERLNSIQNKLMRNARKLMKDVPPEIYIHIDHYLPLSTADSLEFAKSVQKLAPFGKENEQPVFADRNLLIEKTRVFGSSKAHRELEVSTENKTRHNVIFWNSEHLQLLDSPVDMAYKVGVNKFKDNEKVQLEWVQARPTTTKPQKSEPITGKKEILLDDKRTCKNLSSLLEQINSIDTQIYAIDSFENEAKRPLSRFSPCSHLIVWHMPPDNQTLVTLLDKTRPATISFVGMNNLYLEKNHLLNSMKSIIQIALTENNGSLEFSPHAEKFCLPKSVIQKAAECWIAISNLQIASQNEQQLILARGGEKDSHKHQIALGELTILLNEITAYHKMLRIIDLGSFLEKWLPKGFSISPIL